MATKSTPPAADEVTQDATVETAAPTATEVPARRGLGALAITGIAVGGVIVLAATFGGGVLVGTVVDRGGPGMNQGQLTAGGPQAVQGQGGQFGGGGSGQGGPGTGQGSGVRPELPQRDRSDSDSEDKDSDDSDSDDSDSQDDSSSDDSQNN